LTNIIAKTFNASRKAAAKCAFTTRRVPAKDMRTIISGDVQPRSGDLVLARVDELGKQRRIEQPDGRKALMFVGDEIIVCYGNRYAPDQFEALIGDDLSPCDLVAAGGIAAHEFVRHEKMPAPTKISPIGLVGDAAGIPLNLKNYAIPESGSARPIKSIVVVGTSMNAGKTYTSASLVRGLKSAGRRVAAIKVTGTGSGGDLWIMRDVGADVVLDFTDAGYASTYKTPVADLEKSSIRLIEHAAKLGCDYAIIEIADGLGQEETAGLLKSAALQQRLSGVLFAAGDALGAKAGKDILEQMGHRILAISGLLTRSPLALRETRQMTNHLVYRPSDLQIGALAEMIIGEADWGPDNFCQAKSFEAFKRLKPAPKTDTVNGVNGNKGEKFGGQISGRRALRLKRKMEGNGGPVVDAEILLHFLKFMADTLMCVEVDRFCGAEQGVRCSYRTNYRNGYKDMIWTTAVGAIALKVPKLKKGNYSPSFMERHARTDSALIAAFEEFWDHGNTVYWRDKLTKALAGTGISYSEFNQLRTEIADWVQFIKLEKSVEVPLDDLLLRIPFKEGPDIPLLRRPKNRGLQEPNDVDISNVAH